jgi:hypothetical protein
MQNMYAHKINIKPQKDFLQPLSDIVTQNS